MVIQRNPEQECKNEYLVKYIAEWSVKEANNGYQWKFDDTISIN